MKKETKIYLAKADVGGYNIVGSGFTKKQAIDCLWKEYKEHWMEHYWGYDENPTKKEWLEYHGVYAQECVVGQSFVEGC